MAGCRCRSRMGTVHSINVLSSTFREGTTRRSWGRQWSPVAGDGVKGGHWLPLHNSRVIIHTLATRVKRLLQSVYGRDELFNPFLNRPFRACVRACVRWPERAGVQASILSAAHYHSCNARTAISVAMRVQCGRMHNGVTYDVPAKSSTAPSRSGRSSLAVHTATPPTLGRPNVAPPSHLQC